MGVARDSRTRRRAEGFSLIEALIAAALMLVVALGFVPLFLRSSVSNNEGRESTRAANFARSRAEQLYELAFDHPDLTVTAGTERVLTDYFLHDTERWTETEPTGTLDVWIRTTTVRQYHIAALEDGELLVSEALAAGVDPGQVHLKEIEVAVESDRGSTVLGPPKAITVKLLKSQ